jgi:2,3-bisphosphoglycerate-independent phosphoglycerate mutase
MFNFPFFNKQVKSTTKPIVLLILDGFGVAPPSPGNAIELAKMPNYRKYLAKYPSTLLIASGESVGLPANEVGNTEVGHLTMGAGRVIYQELKRISMGIKDGSFYDNKAFLQAVSHTKKHDSKLHLMGIVGSGNVHASMEHLYALLQLCKKEDIKNVYLHLFTDGRDSPPQDGEKMIEELEEHLNLIKIGRIASVSGRYYAMDRDRRWDRTERAYKAIVEGKGKYASSAIEAVKGAYKIGQSDEFIEPTLIVRPDTGGNQPVRTDGFAGHGSEKESQVSREHASTEQLPSGKTDTAAQQSAGVQEMTDKGLPLATVDDNDSVVFFNFRIDRPRQLSMAFVLPDFEKQGRFGMENEEGKLNLIQEASDTTFQRGKILQNVFFVTMTKYQENLPVSAVAYGPQLVENSLSVVLSKEGKRQMHLAESEKRRFVTYYFDGLREDLQMQEEILIVPSPKVATYDKKPEMSVHELAKKIKESLKKDYYHFVVANIANPDMVAHTGNLNAAINALQHVDEALGGIVEEVLKMDGTLLITADHGNAEEMLTYPLTSFYYTSAEGAMNTDHSNNPVPLVVINNKYDGKKVVLPKGSLSDVAPTILGLFGISMPREMTGKNLIQDKNTQADSGSAENQTST